MDAAPVAIPPRANVTDAGTSLPFTGIVVFLGNDGTYTNDATNDHVWDRGYMIARRQRESSPGRMSTFDRGVIKADAISHAGNPTPIPIADLDDEGLVAHADRHAALSILYDRYTPAILHYCRLRIGNLHDAEDTTASILLKAFAGFPPDQRSTFRAWLFTIAHHSVVDFYRRSARAPATGNLNAADHVADNSPTPEEHILRHDDEATLRAAMAKLNDDQRQVIELRLAGLKGAEIASVIGRSHNAVKMLQHRALQRLRAELTSASTISTSTKEPFDAS